MLSKIPVSTRVQLAAHRKSEQRNKKEFCVVSSQYLIVSSISFFCRSSYPIVCNALKIVRMRMRG